MDGVETNGVETNGVETNGVEMLRDIVERVLMEYAEFLGDDSISVCELVFDRRQDRYLLVEVGWENGYRVYGTLLHIDIQNDKLWIQHDGTEDGVADELASAGVPKQSIVLAFRPASLRAHTEFAVA